MPPQFQFPSRNTEIWRPLRMRERSYLNDRNNNIFDVVARLRPGVSLEAAQAELSVIASRLERQYPKENLHHGATAVSMHDELSRGSRATLGALMAAGICVLLIACANLANLLLARALARRKELAVRTAMGAGRERLVRQLATEHLLLAAIGGVFGVGLAFAGLPLLARLVPNDLPIAATPALDLRLLGFAALLTAITGTAFGVIPSLRACGGAAAMQDGARTGGGRKARLRGALVILEVAASVMLLVSAGLLLRALSHVQGIDPGFRAEGVLTLRTPPGAKYATETSRHAYYNRVLSEVLALPGVTNTAYVSGLPMVMRGGIWPVGIHGPDESRGETPSASLRYVTPGFFDAMRIPLRRGRDVSDSDGPEREAIAVVSESFVRQFFAGKEPLGQQFFVASVRRRIAGVVGDVRVRGLERENEPQVYLPARQATTTLGSFYTPKDLVIRSAGAPEKLTGAVRRIVREADAEMPIWDVRLLQDVVDEDIAPRTVQARVIVIFAAVAFVLAAIGIHGVLAFAVAQRTQEIGVRVALGARRVDILGMVLRQGAAMAAAGLAMGVGGAFLAGSAMQALLAGVSPRDPETYAGAVGLACAMTAAGTLLPAVRAVRVDPVIAMRAE
jgi:predicted permease